MKNIDKFCKLIVEINELNHIKDTWVSSINLGEGKSEEEKLEDQLTAAKTEFLTILRQLPFVEIGKVFTVAKLIRSTGDPEVTRHTYWSKGEFIEDHNQAEKFFEKDARELLSHLSRMLPDGKDLMILAFPE